MVMTIGLCFYIAVLYVILLMYRYDYNCMPDSLMSFFDSMLWALVVTLFISLPYIAYVLFEVTRNIFWR